MTAKLADAHSLGAQMPLQDRQLVVKMARNDNLVAMWELFSPQPAELCEGIAPLGFARQVRFFQPPEEFLLFLNRCLGLRIGLLDRFAGNLGRLLPN
ncbi:MAG: hypothetical protein Q8O23_02135 [Gallionella sp.]|nr:hypothetical protein [Gallionella sp.]